MFRENRGLHSWFHASYLEFTSKEEFFIHGTWDQIFQIKTIRMRFLRKTYDKISNNFLTKFSICILDVNVLCPKFSRHISDIMLIIVCSRHIPHLHTIDNTIFATHEIIHPIFSHTPATRFPKRHSTQRKTETKPTKKFVRISPKWILRLRFTVASLI